MTVTRSGVAQVRSLSRLAGAHRPPFLERSPRPPSTRIEHEVAREDRVEMKARRKSQDIGRLVRTRRPPTRRAEQVRIVFAGR